MIQFNWRQISNLAKFNNRVTTSNTVLTFNLDYLLASLRADFNYEKVQSSKFKWNSSNDILWAQEDGFFDQSADAVTTRGHLREYTSI